MSLISFKFDLKDISNFFKSIFKELKNKKKKLLNTIQNLKFPYTEDELKIINDFYKIFEDSVCRIYGENFITIHQQNNYEIFKIMKKELTGKLCATIYFPDLYYKNDKNEIINLSTGLIDDNFISNKFYYTEKIYLNLSFYRDDVEDLYYKYKLMKFDNKDLNLYIRLDLKPFTKPFTTEHGQLINKSLIFLSRSNNEIFDSDLNKWVETSKYEYYEFTLKNLEICKQKING